MARTKSPLTVIQQDEERFSNICEAIVAIGPQKLVETGLIGRTFIFKYRNREGVEVSAERRLMLAIKKAAKKEPVNSVQVTDQAIEAFQSIH